MDTQEMDELELHLHAMSSHATKAAQAYLKRRKALKERVSKFEAKVEKLAAGAQGGEVVRLNVGGTHIDVDRSTLKIVPSRLEWLISGRWSDLLIHDKEGRIFLDVDAAWFLPIISYLKELQECKKSGSVPPTKPQVPEQDYPGFSLLIHIFNLNDAFSVPSNPALISLIAQKDWMWNKLESVLTTQLPQGRPKNLELVYQGSRDGFTAKEFRAVVGGLHNTITLIKDSAGKVLGGFTPETWDGSGEAKDTTNSFLFTLGKDESAPGHFFFVQSPFQAMQCDPDCLVCFGAVGQEELKIVDRCDVRPCTCEVMGTAYEAWNEDESFRLAGKREFYVQEIEVWQVQAPAEEECTRVESSPMNAAKRIVDNRARHRFEDVTHHLQILEDFTQDMLVRCMELEHEIREHEKSESGLKMEISAFSDACNKHNCVCKLTKQAVKNMNNVSPVHERRAIDLLVDRSKILSFNVGGTIFKVTFGTLEQVPESSLFHIYAMAKKESTLEKDKDGNFLLELNPVLFGRIISHLRLLALMPPGRKHRFANNIKPEQRETFGKMISLFELQNVFDTAVRRRSEELLNVLPPTSPTSKDSVSPAISG
eukprot:CAMPEP_0206227020 /NCGR_PEP_ID=MMETSP0047_2-20121206/8401_1 /ASSEMBLY_ACC=CAM_ASM_000192 /TAXON_ID=195065 /ORGANISM="Chroomonas mesostigmatica_cf, Strain CCMP1168" /LENGTH=594 /DNA_ID=CAMNT_0053650145 /DNA_START=86 /DNA_END=1870 /DNA_ORIENTATION=+